MRTINRAALVIRPKEPYIQWAMQVDDTSARHEEALRKHFSVYLVAQDPEGVEESAPIEDYFAEIFERELAGWHLDMDAWPEPRDLKTFHEWFTVEAHSMLVDLEHSRLRAETI